MILPYDENPGLDGIFGKDNQVDCVVADAVVVELVSTAKFPANREKNREFCRIMASSAPETLNCGVSTGL